MTNTVLVRELNNGVYLPAVGYGTWQLANDDTTVASALGALKSGYHHIDTADCYQNQPSLGKAMAQWKAEMREPEVAVEAFGEFKAISVEELHKNFLLPHGEPAEKNRDIFITGKIFTPDFVTEGRMRKSVDRFREQMGRDADLMLLHWPGHHEEWATKEQQMDPKNPENRITWWKVMEKLYAEKRVRAIGVSNYMTMHLEPLIEDILKRKAAGDKLATLPMINQIEVSPLTQPEDSLIELLAKHNIAKTSYSTLGSTADPKATNIKTYPPIVELAKSKGKSTTQVILRWALQKGFLVIPRTSQIPHAKENIAVFNFSLTDTEVAMIDKLQSGARICPDPHCIP